jgi:[FeFe] hydrogenase H-cluster maturation GTPase HydF
METTPKSNRIHIALFGRTNVGKSSLLNLIVGQDVAITSPVEGTTTDVVEKAAEMLPIGPVLFLDTAGLDDTSVLADVRKRKTGQVFDRVDAALIVVEADRWTEYEQSLVEETKRRSIPVLVVINKTDIKEPSEAFIRMIGQESVPCCSVSCTDTGSREAFVVELKRLLASIIPEDLTRTAPLVGDLLPPGGLCVLVVPIDLGAPKGRIILPQVQTIRDALDSDAAALIVKERELSAMLSRMSRAPDLVVCDSQVVLKVTADVPPDIPLTTFSILFARQKGDLAALAQGASAIDTLGPGDRVLIAESCSHHPLQDDIGRVKIPRWLRQYVGGNIDIDVSAGRDFSDDLSDYRLIIHCGGCMMNRREMIHRIESARRQGVPITNYGIAISYLQGVAGRVLSPFPSAFRAMKGGTAAPGREIV